MSRRIMVKRMNPQSSKFLDCEYFVDGDGNMYVQANPKDILKYHTIYGIKSVSDRTDGFDGYIYIATKWNAEFREMHPRNHSFGLSPMVKITNLKRRR